ncbi:hypothetical protein MIND_00557900 [Mycena indigotica]|uniref:Uncharacterized protein n=1 Tax=Mycena indigotica TaxID=2126181 RepID=A0A8H6SZH2_9AGAR|nr:uncharacterized protein MIND_00557900 [Mycena indigotica]KAF7307627.1 hypothetical protein MIND_00557900 [Mycena indigotica]
MPPSVFLPPALIPASVAPSCSPFSALVWAFKSCSRVHRLRQRVQSYGVWRNRSTQPHGSRSNGQRQARHLSLATSCTVVVVSHPAHDSLDSAESEHQLRASPSPRSLYTLREGGTSAWTWGLCRFVAVRAAVVRDEEPLLVSWGASAWTSTMPYSFLAVRAAVFRRGTSALVSSNVDVVMDAAPPPLPSAVPTSRN